MKNITIIDVRTPQEFAAGHVEGSINIPLQELPQRIEEIRPSARLSCSVVQVVIAAQGQN